MSTLNFVKYKKNFQNEALLKSLCGSWLDGLVLDWMGWFLVELIGSLLNALVLGWMGWFLVGSVKNLLTCFTYFDFITFKNVYSNDKRKLLLRLLIHGWCRIHSTNMLHSLFYSDLAGAGCVGGVTPPMYFLKQWQFECTFLKRSCHLVVLSMM